MMKKALWILLVPALIVATACSSDSSSSAATSAGSSAAATELTVFAASSLTGAFTQMGTDFEAANPGVHVTFNFGSSTDLAAQIASEGTADVFASASGTAMDAAADGPRRRGSGRLRHESTGDHHALGRPGEHRLRRRPRQ